MQYDHRRRDLEIDDGGAAKDTARRNKRQMKKLMQIVAVVIAIFSIFSFLISVQHSVTDRIAMKRVRNKISMKQRMERFQSLSNDDNNGDKKSNGMHRNVNNAMEEPDSFEAEDRDYDDCSEDRPKYRWIDLRQLPPLDNDPKWFRKYLSNKDNQDRQRKDYKINYYANTLCWEKKAEEVGDKPPKVDYTKIEYQYPQPILEPPRGGSYPEFQPMEDMFKKWPQDDLDNPPIPFVEKLQHFDFNDKAQMEAAKKYRDLEFPFKVYNIPEMDEANKKWTDEYLTYHFDRFTSHKNKKYTKQEAKQKFGQMPPSSGKAQYSIDSFFAFFVAKRWNVAKMGSPPTMDTDLSFEKWAKHARYADAVGLTSNNVHYYWQSGVPSHERNKEKEQLTMISNDLPSFSDPNPNFFSFNPSEQKGIQCRFGERVCMDMLGF